MRENSGDPNRKSPYPSLFAIIVAICVYFLGIYSGQSSNSSYLYGLLAAVITFLITRYLIDQLKAQGTGVTTSDEPVGDSGIIEESHDEETVPENTGEDSTRDDAVDEGPLSAIVTTGDAPFADVIGLIEQGFKPQIVRDDAELERRLFDFLSLKCPGRVKKDVMSDGMKIDIVLDDSYGFELKVVRDDRDLDGLMRDVDAYTGQHGQMAAVLFVDRLFVSRIDLEKYTEMLDQYGVTVIIKQGMIEAL